MKNGEVYEGRDKNSSFLLCFFPSSSILPFFFSSFYFSSASLNIFLFSSNIFLMFCIICFLFLFFFLSSSYSLHMLFFFSSLFLSYCLLFLVCSSSLLFFFSWSLSDTETCLQSAPFYWDEHTKTRNPLVFLKGNKTKCPKLSRNHEKVAKILAQAPPALLNYFLNFPIPPIFPLRNWYGEIDRNTSSSGTRLVTTFFRNLRAPETAKRLVNYRFQKFRAQKLVNYCFQEFQVGSGGDSYFH